MDTMGHDAKRGFQMYASSPKESRRLNCAKQVCVKPDFELTTGVTGKT